MAAPTSRGIPRYDELDTVELHSMLNGQSEALDTALGVLESNVSTSLGAGANLFKGTAAQRAAFTTATNGQLWQDTDGSMGLYRRQGGAWMRLVDGNATPFAMAAGTLAAVTITAQGSNSVSVTFPTGRFSVPPVVTVSLINSARDITAWASGVTKDGFTLNRGSMSTVARSGIAASWQAVQMTPTEAAG